MSSSCNKERFDLSLVSNPPDTKLDELLCARKRKLLRDKNGELWFLGPACLIGVGESSPGDRGVSVEESGNSKPADSPRAEGEECRLYDW